MSMVADLEEERMGKKRQIVNEEIEEEEEDFNMNFVIKQDVTSEESFPQDSELVFKVENENFVEIPEENTSDGSEDLSDTYDSYHFTQEKRKFHFTNLKVYTSAPLNEEYVDTVPVDVDDMMDEDDKDVGKGLAVAKQPEPEDLTNAEEKEEEHNSFSESVLEKIEALKRIDEKLLNIEKEKGKRLKTALSSSSGGKKYGMYQNPKKRLEHRHRSPSLVQGNRRTGKYRNRDASSSSSSISSSDSSSSSNDDSTSENEEIVKRNAGGQEADDLRNKLKQYLTKLKRKGVKKTD